MGTDEAGIAGNRPSETDLASGTESKPKPAAPSAVNVADDALDPDEDDLDDLDDMLEEFSTVKLNAKKGVPKPSAVAPTIPTSAHPPTGDTSSAAGGPLPELDDFSEEEFQKQLQAGMAELMGDLENSPEMQAQFESIFKGLAGEDTESKDGESSSIPKSAEAIAAELSQDGSFQETIRRTMDRMHTSGEQATAAAAAEGSEDDFIAEMIKAMGNVPGGDGNEEDFSKILMGMMEQLTNKEILYEPMKELNDKFPGWMEKNKDTLQKDDAKRYHDQQQLVSEMVKKFEEPTYSDSNAADREYIVDRMQKNASGRVATS